MLELIRHHRRRIAWLPLMLLSLSVLSLFAQGCLAVAPAPDLAPDHAEHARHAGHTMPCCEHPGDCGNIDCLGPACPGMQAVGLESAPALAGSASQPLPEPLAILAPIPLPPNPAAPPVLTESSLPADPGQHPAQRFHRLRI